MKIIDHILSLIKLIFLLLVFLFMLSLVIWIFTGGEEIKKEKAYEKIMDCQNPYALWQGVDGESCDRARKLYYNYSDEEWKVEKKILVDLGRITEQDYLYYELQKELDSESN